MGVCCWAKAVSDALIDQVLANPPLVLRIVSPENMDAYWEATGQLKKPGLLAKLFGAKPETEPASLPLPLSLPEPPVPNMDLDKAWDGINFCLKKIIGDQPPNFFEGGTPVGEIEIGYGPALAWRSADVAAFAEKIALLQPADLLAHYDPVAMKKVYLGAAWSRGGEDDKQYLVEGFQDMKNFLQTSATRRLGCLVFFT